MAQRGGEVQGIWVIADVRGNRECYGVDGDRGGGSTGDLDGRR